MSRFCLICALLLWSIAGCAPTTVEHPGPAASSVAGEVESQTVSQTQGISPASSTNALEGDQTAHELNAKAREPKEPGPREARAADIQAITETATSICGTASLQAGGQTPTLSADASAKLNRLIAALDVGASKYSEASTQGVLQQDLAGAIANVNDCKAVVSKQLLDVMFPTKAQPTAPKGPKNAGYVIVKAYFGTDRNVVGGGAAKVFGVQRSTSVSYGAVDVSIPHDHRLGELESPSLWHLEFHEDPEKHVMVLRTSVLSQPAFFKELKTDVLSSARKSLLVFVHGFNVSFTDAARRTAQMAYDLGFDGIPVFFSWPSQDQTRLYTVDEQSIIDAEPHLEQFLRDVLRQSDADNIYLIAHSMGNRGLTRALAALAIAEPREVKRIKEVILAAPDIGTVEFTEQIVPGLRKLGAPITLYASSNDHALALSEQLHGGARAGESGAHMVVVDGIETVDASNTDTDLIGHSYYGDRRTVLADMYYLINGDLRPNQRCCLDPIPKTSPRYWVFMK